MSQRSQMDGAQQGFAVGRGLLAAAETLNFGMNQLVGGASGAGGVMEGQEGSSRMSRGGVGGNLGSTMKLFASLGLSPSDLDALAQIPEEDISVETLPQIIMQLKNRKGDMGRGAASSMSSDKSYRSGGWDNEGRMGGTSLGQGSGPSDFGFTSPQEVSLSRGLGLNYGGGNRGRYPSEPSRHDSYGSLQGASLSEPGFLQRRKGSPSEGKVQDFLGVLPPMFPHVCSLCDFDVHSTMEWNQHTNGLRHAENRRVLLNMYPEWDPSVSSGRSLMESTNMSAGLLGPPPSGPEPAAGMMSNWGSGLGPGMSGKNLSGQNMMRSRVVVVKYDRKPLSNKTLFAFTEPFGRLREHLILKNKAFLEMERHEEAQDMVNYYQLKPAMLYGKPVTFYLSRRLMAIEKDQRSSDRAGDRLSWEGKGRGSKVVYFSDLPREEDQKEELLTIAARFGVVEKHLFFTNQAFVQLGTSEDAEMMVKYYNVNPLTIKGRDIRINICTKYKTLNINRRQEAAGNSRRGGANSTHSAPRNTSSSPSRSRDDEHRAKSSSEDEEDKEGEEVSGVVEGDENTSEAGAEGVEPEETEEGVQEKVPDDEDGVTSETPADVSGATVQPEQGEESEEQKAEAGSAEEHEPEQDQNFLENMEEFVTLDELADEEEELAENEGQQSDGIDTSRRGGLRVVNILGFRRGYNFLDELLGLAKPFGKLVRHLVLDRRPEAFLQFAKEDEARAMVKFYNRNVSASVCGRPVRVNLSMTYPTIQYGVSRVVYVGQLPNSKYSDEDVFKLAEPFGKVRKYFLNRIKRECFLEMERAEDAYEMAEAYKANQPKLNGRRLLVYVSRKYTQLKYGHQCLSAAKRETSSSPPKSAKRPKEGPPAKKIKKDKPKEEGKQFKPQEDEAVKEEEAQKEPQEEVADKGEEQQKKPQEEEEEQQHMNPQEEGAVKEDEENMIPQEEAVAVKEKEEHMKLQDEKAVIEDEEQIKLQAEQEEIKPRVEEEVPSLNQKTEMDTTEKIPRVLDQNQQPTEEEVAMETSADEDKRSVASLPLPPFNPNKPIGLEHVKMGYYCRVCLLFYSNEDMAKKKHCSSQTHYDKLQKHLEKEKSKAEKKRAKKTDA
ncbi:matrin 3-like 1.2 isoform X2 [Dunckerocampus dactyliophorus]|uniref:matrin 3-like 1.2 isoform X2 n=1 Tax=Dunckerocampus dactyliophorus TaxID=161453 RepID=UPI0024052967|nr:matrin 3-like 1.2 isoform X2 [Dunckerocampus dactyliophorus]